MTINGSGLTNISGIIPTTTAPIRPGQQPDLQRHRDPRAFHGRQHLHRHRDRHQRHDLLATTTTLQNETVAINCGQRAGLQRRHTTLHRRRPVRLGQRNAAHPLERHHASTSPSAAPTTNPSATYSGVLAGPAVLTNGPSAPAAPRPSAAPTSSPAAPASTAARSARQLVRPEQHHQCCRHHLVGNYVHVLLRAGTRRPPPPTSPAAWATSRPPLPWPMPLTLDLHGFNLAVGANRPPARKRPGCRSPTTAARPSTLTIGYATATPSPPTAYNDLLTDGTSTLAWSISGVGTRP